MSEIKVCPNCGGHHFAWRRKVLQDVIIDGNFNAVQVVGDTVLDYYDDEPMPRPECRSCGMQVPAFVTEEFFHEVICDPEFTEVQMIFVPRDEVIRRQRILDITEGYAEGYGKDEVIATYSAEFEQGEYVVDIKVCNGDTPYVDPVIFQRTVDGNAYSELYPLDASDTLLGEYIFEIDDKKFKVIVTEEQFEESGEED